MKKFVKDNLFQFTSELYAFAHSLIPDDLQAIQLVSDSFSILGIEKQELMIDLAGRESVESMDIEKMRNILFNICFSIGRKRSFQLGSSVERPDGFELFYDLTIDERAVLFLSNKLNLQDSDICEIVDKNAYETLSIKHLAVGKITALGDYQTKEMSFGSR